MCVSLDGMTWYDLVTAALLSVGSDGALYTGTESCQAGVNTLTAATWSMEPAIATMAYPRNVF